MPDRTQDCAALIDGSRCTSGAEVLTWCRYHWRQQHDGRTFTIHEPKRPRGAWSERDDQGRKRCARCLEWRALDDYGPAKRTGDRLQSWCSPCSADYAMLNRYGLTRADVERMVAEQGGCGICGTATPRNLGFRNGWHVDHDHGCCPGERTCGCCIRGILCADCNKLIGLAQDSRERLRQAMTYLRDCEARHERAPQAHVGQQAPGT